MVNTNTGLPASPNKCGRVIVTPVATGRATGQAVCRHHTGVMLHNTRHQRHRGAVA